MALLSPSIRGSLFAVAAAAAVALPAQATADDASIRPFHVHVSDSEIADMRRRIVATRWPDKETVGDASQGSPLGKLQELVRYWGTGYDWRRFEAKLNALPLFVTNIDGVDVQFIHVRSKQKNALPVIVTHGWSGSIVELLGIIGPLTDPTAHGGTAADAFDVVIPSIPGYGFSGRPTGTGWDPERIARAWSVMMKRLGYSRWVAQGGDWGAVITSAMARQAPAGLVAIHLNLPAAIPPEVAAALATGAPAPEGLSEREKATFDASRTYAMGGNAAYFAMLTARPQAVGYGMADSPAGLAAWILVHPGFTKWSWGAEPTKHPTKDEVLDNISLYWLTNTGTSAGRLYWENRGQSPTVASVQKTAEIALPVGVTLFGEDAYRPPETWLRRAYKNLVYFHETDRGGHFAAWEQPELFGAEVRAAFKSLR